MARDLAHQLRYLGVIPQQGHIDYGFRIEDKDKNVRLIILEIEDCVFERRDLLFQEAPDLCYQKVLLDLGNETVDSPIDARIPVTDSDVARYRESHPIAKSRRPVRRNQG